MQTTLWDKLASTVFDTSKNDALHSSAMDNILIAHPAVHSIIASYFGSRNDIEVLDFGCGTGGFVKELSDKNYSVIGMDPSQGMIDIAKSRNIPYAEFICGEIHSIDRNSSFDLIVSIMVFQFIGNLEQESSSLLQHLKKDGLLIIVVHNDDYVAECLLKKSKFRNITGTHQIYITLGDAINVPIYKRSENDYWSLFNRLSLKQYQTIKPPFTEEYLSKIDADSVEPTVAPKFLISSYIK